MNLGRMSFFTWWRFPERDPCILPVVAGRTRKSWWGRVWRVHLSSHYRYSTGSWGRNLLGKVGFKVTWIFVGIPVLRATQIYKAYTLGPADRATQVLPASLQSHWEIVFLKYKTSWSLDDQLFYAICIALVTAIVLRWPSPEYTVGGLKKRKWMAMGNAILLKSSTPGKCNKGPLLDVSS